MTKYILHGGCTTRENELNKKFFSEIGANLNDGDSVLMCYFAPSENSGMLEAEKFERGIEMFKKNIPDKKLELIFANRENFIDQIKKADVLYIHGGETEGLFNDLKKYPDFIEEMKKKKLVVGSSSGAYVLTKYSIDYAGESMAEERFGVLPINIYCHFEEKNRKDLEEEFVRVDKDSQFENVFLADCETIVF